MPLTRAQIALMTPEQQLARRVRMRELGRKGGNATKRRAAADPGYFVRVGRMGAEANARAKAASE